MMRNVDYLLVCLLAICPSFFGEVSIKALSSFFNQVIFVFDIVWKLTPYQIHGLQIFFPFIGCLRFYSILFYKV